MKLTVKKITFYEWKSFGPIIYDGNYLKAVKAKLYGKEAELLDRGFVITAQLLYDAYFDKVACLKERSLLSVLEEHNAERKAMIKNENI